MAETEAGRPIRRVERSEAPVTEEDLKIALDLEKEGKTIPDSLKPALEAYHKEHGSKGTPPKSDEDEEDEDDDAPGGKGSESEEDEEDDETPAPKPKSKPDEGDEEEEDEEEEESDEDSEDEDEDDEEDEDDVESGTPQRPLKYLPISRYEKIKAGWKKREEDLRGELDLTKKQLTDLQKASTEVDAKKQEQMLKDLSESTGFAVDDLKKMIDFIATSLGLSPEVLKRLKEGGAPEPSPGAAGSKEAKAEKEKQFWANQYAQFDKLFDAEIKQPGADPDMAKHKERIRKLYFTKGNEHKSIFEIWNRDLKQKVSRKGKPPETPGGFKGGGGGDLDWDAIANDPEKIRALTPEQAEKFTEHMGSRPRPIRRPKFTKPQ